MSRQHYHATKEGQWTYYEHGASGDPVIFRKGSKCDPIANQHTDAWLDDDYMSPDFALSTSEWVTVHEDVLDRMLDLVNEHEAEHGRILE